MKIMQHGYIDKVRRRETMKLLTPQIIGAEIISHLPVGRIIQSVLFIILTIGKELERDIWMRCAAFTQVDLNWIMNPFFFFFYRNKINSKPSQHAFFFKDLCNLSSNFPEICCIFF